MTSTFEGVDLGPDVDLDHLVSQHLAGVGVGYARRDDRTPLDWLARAWRFLDEHEPLAAKRFSRAVAGQLGGAHTELVLRFFWDLPLADGGERLAMEVLRRLHCYPPDLLDQTPGTVTDTVREGLIRGALGWNEGRGLSPEVVAIAWDEIEAGRGRALLYYAARLDPDGARARLPGLLPRYPDASPTFLRILLGLGEAPEHAVELLLAHADPVGREALFDELRYRFRSEPARLEALLTLDPAR